MREKILSSDYYVPEKNGALRTLILLESFRLDQEYETEWEYDFRISN